MADEQKPVFTIRRRGSQRLIQHKCTECNHTTYSVSSKATDRFARCCEEGKDFAKFGHKMAMASRCGTAIQFEGKQYFIHVSDAWISDREHLESNFPDAHFSYGFRTDWDSYPFKITAEKKKDTWYCFDCPCNDGETKIYKSHAGLYNHRKTCKGDPRFN